MYCRRCHYNLTGLSETTCPECGRGFDPKRADTYLASPPMSWQRITRWCALLLVVTAGGSFLLIWGVSHAYDRMHGSDGAASAGGLLGWELILSTMLVPCTLILILTGQYAIRRL